MTTHVRRLFGDAMVSAGVIAVILAVLISVDGRLREQLDAAVRAASGQAITGTGSQVHMVGAALVDAVRTQSIEHAPLMIFVVVATVLLLAFARS